MRSSCSLLVLGILVHACTWGDANDREGAYTVDTEGKSDRPCADASDCSLEKHPEERLDEPPGIYKIASLDFDRATEDMRPLAPVVGDSRIVAIGETIHFSEGFARARAATTRFLVEELGFRILVFEGNWQKAFVTNAFLREGTGTAEDAIWGLTFAAWVNEPTLELLKWLRAFNIGHPDDMVSLYAIDVQNPNADFQLIQQHLTWSALDEQAGPLLDDLRSCPGAHDPEDPLLFGSGAGYEADRLFQLCVSALARLEMFFSTHASEIERGVGTTWYLFTATRSLIASAEEYLFADLVQRSYEARDLGMADLFERMDEAFFAKQRVVFTAHNAHTLRNAALNRSQTNRFKSVGSWLAERYLGEYRPIGFIAHEYAWNWPNFGSGVWRAPDDCTDCVENMLRPFGETVLADLRLTTVVPMDTGLSMADDQIQGSPSDFFDALLFLEHSEAAP